MRGKNIIYLSLVATLVMSLMMGIGSAPSLAKISIDPSTIPDPPTQGLPGDSFDVTVKIENVFDLWSIGFIVQYHPYARPLAAGFVIEGDFMKQGDYETSFVYKIDVFKGYLKISITRLLKPGEPPVGASGDGVLATFAFSVVEAGESDIEFIDVYMYDSNLDDIPFSTFGGNYYGATANLVGMELGKRNVGPIDVTNEQVGREEYVSVTGESVGVEEWISVEDELVGVEEWGFATNETVGVEEWAEVINETVGIGESGQKVFYLANPPVIEGTETIYADGVPQTRDVDYTIDYETGEIAFKTPQKDVLITSDYYYDGQWVFYLAGTPVHEDTETIYADGVPQTRDVDYTIDYETGEITFTYLLSNGAVITADYIYDGQWVFYLAGTPVHEGTETICVRGVAQVRDVDYTIDYPSGTITFTYLPSNGSDITADYMYDGQLTFSLAAPVLTDSETVYVDTVAQERGVDYTIDNFAGEMTFTYYPDNGAVITADYTQAQWVFSLKHAPVWKGILTVYVDGVVQEEGVDYNADTQSGVISFTYFPDDGAVITADYQYGPTKYFTGKVKSNADVPLLVRTRFDIERLEDGRRIVLYDGQEYVTGGLGEPPPVVYLYVNEYNEWLEWDWYGPKENVFGPPDGNYISTNIYDAYTSRYGFDDLSLLPGESILDVLLQAYTQADSMDIDVDPYGHCAGTGWLWIDSLWGGTTWDWHIGRYYAPGYAIDVQLPEVYTLGGINSFELLLMYWTPTGGTMGDFKFDSIRLRVELSPLVILGDPDWHEIQPGEELQLAPVVWTISEGHIGTYVVTATLEYSLTGGVTYMEGAKTQIRTFEIEP